MIRDFEEDILEDCKEEIEEETKEKEIDFKQMLKE